MLIGDSLSEGTVAEADRALTDHELIKVRIHTGDRAARVALADALTQQLNATLIQSIGKIIVLHRSNPDARAHLSNVLRHR